MRDVIRPRLSMGITDLVWDVNLHGFDADIFRISHLWKVILSVANSRI